MSQAERTVEERDNTRRTIFIIVALASALLVAGLVYLGTRPTPVRGEPRLEGALRAGTPEFDQLRERIVVVFDPDSDASQSTRAIGDIVVTMRPVVRNITGRTINGLELHAAVVDIENKPVRERTVIAIPARQPELENNKSIEVPIIIEGFKKSDTLANIRVEVTGVKFR